MNSRGRSVVIYVWNNDEQKLVALYRAVRPKDLGRECAAGFDGYFAIERLNEFVAGLYKTHASRPVAIRDWIASSAEEFHATRLGWTKQEFERFGPKISADVPAPSPVFQARKLEWELKGVEFLSNAVGMPAGIPIEKPRVIEAMKTYMARGKDALIAELRDQGLEASSEAGWSDVLVMMKQRGYRIFDSAADVPFSWHRVSALDRLGALQLLDREIDARGDRFLELAFPHRDRKLYETFQKSYGKKLIFRLHSDPNEPRYYFQVREKEDVIGEWWLGTHQDELERVFGSLVA